MISLLHICPDDKFIDVAVELFNNLQCHNSYVCIKESAQPFKYIHTSTVKPVKPDELLEICKNSMYDVYVFHTLDSSRYKYVFSIQCEKKIIWLSWGYDLYQSVGGYPAIYPIKLYKPLTAKWLNLEQHATIYKRLRSFVKMIIHPQKTFERKKKELQQIQNYLREQQKVISRIDYLSTILPSEYSQLKNKIGLKAKYFPFQYSKRSKEDVMSLIDFDNANWILVGNSATATNNHLDIFEVCKERKINSTLYVPLAYGDNLYADALMEKMKGMNNIIFQKEFLSIDAYRNKLMRCRAIILGHVRQQAIGNLVMGVLQGSKVFLYKDSMAYVYFKREGYEVFSIEDDLTQEAIQIPLSSEAINANRKKILKWLSIENVIERIGNVLNEIEL